MTNITSAEKEFCKMECVEDKSFSTEEAIRRQILQVRSKYCEPILELLAEEGELYHGDLADRLQMSPSGLNAIIKKIQVGSIPVIKTTQVGKYKIYSLSNQAKAYVQKRTMSKVSEKNLDYSQSNNLFLCLQRFVEYAGDRWREQLNVLLQGQGDELEDRVKMNYQELIECLIMTDESSENEMKEFKSFLGNEVLAYLVERYLREIAECRLFLKQIDQRDNGPRMRQILKKML